MSTVNTGPGAEPVELEINGDAVTVRAALSTTLLSVLREELHLTAAKRGCNQGVCGACTVSIDGVPMRACLSLAHGCAGRPIRTLEGLIDEARLHALQRAFAECAAFQCGSARFRRARPAFVSFQWTARRSSPSCRAMRPSRSINANVRESVVWSIARTSTRSLARALGLS